MTPPRIRHVLFDFDGVLADYRHDLRVGHLAAFCDAAHARVHAVLFDSGLETEYDGGGISTELYLSRLSEGLARVVDQETWIGSRLAGCHVDPRIINQVLALDDTLELGVLTNNGALMAEAIPRIVAPLFPRLHGRVLCSGGLRIRKPDPRVFEQALDQLGWTAGETLFVDDVFANVQGARSVGLHAETVSDAKTMRRVFKRYALA